MPVSFVKLSPGELSDRPTLARLWGYKKYNAIARGVITPKGANYIVLFVTKLKQDTLTQYRDFKDGDFLIWEGESKHGSDERICNSPTTDDEIHLFYRERHHSPFVYEGEIRLCQAFINSGKPSIFRFNIGSTSISNEPSKIERVTVAEATSSYRIGQQQFRIDQIREWGACAVTGCSDLRLLRAAHIKPWKDSTSKERLDPANGILLSPVFDALFDHGIASFEDSGRIRLASNFSTEDRHRLGVTGAEALAKPPSPRAKLFLEFHRDTRFEKKGSVGAQQIRGRNNFNWG